VKFLAVLADGFEDLEAIGTIALLRRSGMEVETASVSEKNIVTGSFKTPVLADTLLSKIKVEHYDGLFLPGGAATKTLRESQAVTNIVKAFAKANKYLTAICAAPSVYGALGLLDGKHYTCFPSLETYMPKGIKENKPAVIDGLIVTGAGAGAVTEFALAVIETTLGKAKADEVSKRILFRIYE